MPTEERYIKFNFEEVKKALLIYSIEKKSEALAPGEISAVSLNQDNGAINVVIDQENGDKSDEPISDVRGEVHLTVSE